MKPDDDCFLWIDLKLARGNTLLDSIHGSCRGYRVSEYSAIQKAIENTSPRLLCFEFDDPDGAGLSVLRKIKKEYPELPILMLTEAHSEALAVWAYRNRVWDYLVQPFSVEELERRMEILMHIGKGASSRQPYFPSGPNDATEVSARTLKATSKAVAYIEANFTRKIRLMMLAELCSMSPYHFCRVFKEENGMTFVDFMLKKRIEKACLILESRSVKEAAFEVGFNDPSYFSRVFRRYVGASPTQYLSARGYPARSGLSCPILRHPW